MSEIIENTFKPISIEDRDLITRSIFNQHPMLTHYLCHWSKKYRFIYVEAPKVACTTIKQVLQFAEAGEVLVYDNPSFIHDRDRSPLLGPFDDIEAFSAAIKSNSYFIFCFVRNPFSRALSCWLDKMVNNEFERQRLAPQLGIDPGTAPTFLKFLEAVVDQDEEERDPHWASQTYLLRPNRIQYSCIGRFEQFSQEFKLICDEIGISNYAKNLADSWHATNAKNKVKENFGMREIELIHQIYEYDFRNFGYGWSPRVV